MKKSGNNLAVVFSLKENVKRVMWLVLNCLMSLLCFSSAYRLVFPRPIIVSDLSAGNVISAEADAINLIMQKSEALESRDIEIYISVGLIFFNIFIFSLISLMDILFPKNNRVTFKFILFISTYVLNAIFFYCFLINCNIGNTDHKNILLFLAPCYCLIYLSDNAKIVSTFREAFTKTNNELKKSEKRRIAAEKELETIA